MSMTRVPCKIVSERCQVGTENFDYFLDSQSSNFELRMQCNSKYIQLRHYVLQAEHPYSLVDYLSETVSTPTMPRCETDTLPKTSSAASPMKKSYFPSFCKKVATELDSLESGIWGTENSISRQSMDLTTGLELLIVISDRMMTSARQIFQFLRMKI